MARKPKPIEVGHVGCPFHSSPQQARVKKSLVTNKLFIDCPACGLIMPTLANFQEWIKDNAEFDKDFAGVFNGNVTGQGTDADAQRPVGGGVETSKRETEPKDQAEKEEAPPAKAEPPKKPQPVKSSFDQEMGF